MFHRHRARTALAALVTAASAVAAFASPAAAAGQAHDGHHGHHGRHHHQAAWHHARHQSWHHVGHQSWHHVSHHRTHLHAYRSRGLPSTPFLLRNRATGSCLTAESHRHYNVYALAACAHRKSALWTVDRASGTLRNVATERCVLPGYAEDFSCARLAGYGRGFAVHRDAAGRISYRAVTGKRYLNLTRRMSGGYIFGATYTMEPRHSPMGMEQRWAAEVV